MYRILIFLLLMAIPLSSVSAQTNRKRKGSTAVVQKKTQKKTEKKTVGGLRNKQDAAKKRIAAEKKRLAENEKNVRKRLQELMIINNDIKDKKERIDTINRDIRLLDGDIAKMNKQLKVLEAELKDNQDKYVKSLRYMHRNRSDQNQLMFVFSADNFSQMYRRMRFMREYATFQRQQGERVKAKQKEVGDKRTALRQARNKQARLLAGVKNEEKNLKLKQNDQQKMVASLQKQHKTIQNVIEQQTLIAQQLEEEIDRLVAIEVEKARLAAQKEAAAHRKTIEDKRKKGEQLSKIEVEAERRYSEDVLVTAADYKLNGNFAANRGRLPIPVTGGYRIVNRYGNYNVEGLRNVRLNNKGINILASKGARVRSVFDGVVSTIFRLPGDTRDGVMVRHGSYITIYWPVVNTKVKKGERVSARQALGNVDNSSILEFQLRKETARLNPEPWLGK